MWIGCKADGSALDELYLGRTSLKKKLRRMTNFELTIKFKLAIKFKTRRI